MKRLVMSGLLATFTVISVAKAGKTNANPVIPSPASAAPTVVTQTDDRNAIQNINPQVYKMAMEAYDCAILSGKAKPKTLTIIDYSLPSNKDRMWVIDMQNNKVLFNNLVAHGQGSGGLMATDFSNNGNSHQTSLGLFLTEDTYQGHNGLSLRLKGLDVGFNDKAMQRSVVMHGAPYVSDAVIQKTGRLGRSWGCPAVSKELAKPIIDTIKGGDLVFAYYPDKKFLAESKYINCPSSVMANNQKPAQQPIG